MRTAVKNISTFALILLLGPIFAAPVTREDVVRGLQASGKERRQAIWFVHQLHHHDLLPQAARLLLESDDYGDHRAVLNVFHSYGRSLESYLPDWHLYLDRYIRPGLPDDILLDCVRLADYWRERRLVGALKRLATHPRTRIRKAAFRSISLMKDDNMIPIILTLFASERTVERVYALEAAAMFPDTYKRLTPFIMKLFQDPEKSVRIYAIRAFLRQEDAADHGHSAVRTLSRDEDPEVRSRILEAIASKGWNKQAYVLHRALTDESPLVRLSSLRAIEKLGDTAGAHYISRRLPDEEDTEVKLQALASLLSLGRSGGGAGLSHLVRYDPDRRVRLKAVMCVGVLEEARGGDALVHALEFDSDEKVREEAASALGDLGREEATAHLLAAIRRADESYDVKTAALLALSRIGGRDAMEGLARLEHSLKDSYFRRRVSAILKKMNEATRER